MQPPAPPAKGRPDPPEDSSESSPSVEIAPTPQLTGHITINNTNTTPVMPGQYIMLQPPSSAPKVIGIFVMIFAGFQLISIPFLFLPQTDPFTGEELVIPFYALIIEFLGLLISVIGYGLGGFWTFNYQRRGVQLVLTTIAINFVLSIVSVALGGDVGLSSGLGIGKGAAIGIVSAMSAVCSVVCVLIAAIPLMIANSGLDDSTLVSLPK